MLRINLWKVYNNDNEMLNIPKFGLNFIKDESKKNKKFLLICGFENFENFFIRIDILERLFLKIIDCTQSGKFKINSDMINLIGSSKENFFKLLKLMHYKQKKLTNNKEEFFIYEPKHNKTAKKHKKYNKNNPFSKLSELRF